MRDRFKVRGSRIQEDQRAGGEQGYMLLACGAIAIILLWLGVLRPRRLQHSPGSRGGDGAPGQPVCARHPRFLLKNGSHYPGSIEQFGKDEQRAVSAPAVH